MSMIAKRLIVGVDVMSLIHPLVRRHEGASIAIWDKVIIPAWCRKMASPQLWIPSSQRLPTSTVFLLDKKDPSGKYWRHYEFAGYKSGRASHADLLGYVRDRCMETVANAGYPVLVTPGFEADDWAGELTRALCGDDRLFLLSVDSDWGQLVSERVIWLDSYCATKRTHMDQASRVLDHGTTIKRFNSYVKHKTFPITRPREIVDLKWILGDKADGIPKGKVVNRGIIDLLSPMVYPTAINLEHVLEASRSATLKGGNDVPMYFLGLPRFSDYGVNLDSMTTILTGEE